MQREPYIPAVHSGRCHGPGCPQYLTDRSPSPDFCCQECSEAWHRMCDDGVIAGPDPTWVPLCVARYERRGGAQPGDRVVECILLPGHPGDHEDDTGTTWAATPRAPASPLDMWPCTGCGLLIDGGTVCGPCDADAIRVRLNAAHAAQVAGGPPARGKATPITPGGLVRVAHVPLLPDGEWDAFERRIRDAVNESEPPRESWLKRIWRRRA